MRGGAGLRQLKDQGLVILGGSRGPRLTAVVPKPCKWWEDVPGMVKGLSTLCKINKNMTYHLLFNWTEVEAAKIPCYLQYCSKWTSYLDVRMKMF